MPDLITNAFVKSLNPRDKVYEVRDKEIKGFVLRVHPTGRMVYFMVYARGKRKKLGVHPSTTPTMARTAAKSVLGKFHNGEDPSDEKRLAKAQTFKQFLDNQYEDWLKANLRTGKATFDSLDTNFKEFHNLKLFEITPWLVEKWRLRRQKDGVKPTTINRQLADLKACLTRAAQWGVVESNQIEKVKGSRIDSSPKIRYLAEDEESKLRKALDIREQKLRTKRESHDKWKAERKRPIDASLQNTAYADYLKPAVLLSINTGLRRGELFGLKWQDIDFNQKILTVVAETAKSGKTRHVPLNTEALSILTDWRKQCHGDYVFEGKSGKPFHDLRTSWATILNEKHANIKDFRWHDLRHTFASKLVMGGVDLNTVRELLGHSDYKMTLRYAHLAPEHKAAAVERLCTS
jgi:integrase